MSSPVPALPRQVDKRTPGRGSSPSRVARVLVGTGWLTLGVLKLYDLPQVGVDSKISIGLVVLATSVEISVGVLALLPYRSGFGPCLASILLGVVLLALAWSSAAPEGCGCFGALGRAERWQRVVVASAMLYASLEWWSARLRPSAPHEKR